MAKLVRDRVGDLEWTYSDAKAALRPVRDVDEHIDFLHRKLLEEVGELIMATSRDGIAEEAADLIEVIRALCQVRGVPLRAVEITRLDKLASKGGFTGGVIWDV